MIGVRPEASIISPPNAGCGRVQKSTLEWASGTTVVSSLTPAMPGRAYRHYMGYQIVHLPGPTFKPSSSATHTHTHGMHSFRTCTDSCNSCIHTCIHQYVSVMQRHEYIYNLHSYSQHIYAGVWDFFLEWYYVYRVQSGEIAVTHYTFSDHFMLLSNQRTV